MHNYIVHRVLRAEILFFDKNPIGRIVTRFSKDVSILDFVVAPFLVFISHGMLRTLTVCITVGIINPWLFIGIAIALGFMYVILKLGSGVMVQSQALDGVLRGPIHNTFAMVISGLVTLRVFDRVAYFKQDFNNTLEKCANATFAFNMSNRWVGLRLDMVCCFITIMVTAIAFA
jgi:ABC-type bacteriocin/lantibiotic exporter with double-glycine peptidase domain